MLTFLATKAGEITIYAYASGDNYNDTDSNRDSTTIYIEGNETTADNTVSAGNIAKRLPETGNALLLLGLALCSFIPFYRRD